MQHNARLNVVLVGADSLLIACGELLLDKGHAILAVASDAAKVRAWAEQRGLAVFAPRALAGELAPHSFDYLFAITHLALLPEAALALPLRAAINFHDGPLPRYAGLNAPAWAILRGETEYGISWHEIRGGIDEGALLRQRRFELAPLETSLSLNTRNFAAAIESFAELIDELAAGSVVRTPQDLRQRSYFGKHQRPAAACTLDFTRPASELHALVRALDFGDYDNPLGLAKLVHGGKLLALRAAELVPGSVTALSEPEAGRVLAVCESGIEIATPEGSLRLLAMSSVTGATLPLTAAAEQLGLGVLTKIEPLSEPIANALRVHGEALARAEAFWLTRLRRLEPAVLALAEAERARGGPPVELAWQLPAALRALPADAVASQLLAAFAVYLARTSGKSAFDLGYRDQRPGCAARELGPFVAEQVPLRVEVDEAFGFAQNVERLRDELSLLARKAPMSCDLVARDAELRRRPELVNGLLAQVAVLWRTGAEPVALPKGVSCALVLSAQPDASALLCDPDALDASRRALLLHHLDVLLTAALAQPHRPVNELALLDAEDLAQLAAWNDTARPVSFACIHSQFEAQAARTPEQTALVFEDVRLSYAELDRRANAVAARLREHGVVAETFVGVHVERSEYLVIAALGVLKAGGAYLPLDPSYPEARIDFMLRDSGARVVLTDAVALRSPAHVRCIDVRAAADDAGQVVSAPQASAGRVLPEHLAYVIYTSGSTGTPKGVLVEHRQVANFFAGMDAVIPHRPGDTFLSVTSLSFDISVLELFWSLARGLCVVVYRDRARSGSASSVQRTAADSQALARPLGFSLFMWGAQDSASADTYTLMLDVARFGDQHGFSAIWMPERHFHAFGGAYPNPSLTSAALATVTDRIQIRAGSCVVPLHHPARIAEEWAVVDNLSHGRVGIAFASGWQPDDFVLQPGNYRDNKRIMLEQIEQVRRLWRGETVAFAGPLGNEVHVRTQPRPVQPELPFWFTAAGNPETFRLAGQQGANMLTHLLGQSLGELRAKIAIYRTARAEAGFDPESGVVTLMLHTSVGESVEAVRERVREPLKAYLRTSVQLVKDFAWAFPAFKRPAGVAPDANDIDLAGLSESELDAILEFAFERYFEASGLFGTPESCMRMLREVSANGVDDVACLVDYGVPSQAVRESLPYLDELRERAQAAAPRAVRTSSPQAVDSGSGVYRAAKVPASSTESSERFSLAAQLRAEHVTHLQCTPALLRMARVDDAARAAIDAVPHLMIGGEAFPVDLAESFAQHVGSVTNMYGPTETCVWSATQRLAGAGPVPLGRPIANTRLYVLDAQQRLLPVGVPGELYIAGHGVVRGYHARPELTRERFLPDPFVPGARMYRSGDRVRWSSRGELEFLGRTDHQVKVRGYRIELGEIEALLLQERGVREAVVLAREDTAGDVRLIAYASGDWDEASLRERARMGLPSYMVPAAYVRLPQLPQTPNGKLDRNALPQPDAVAQAVRAYAAPESELEASLVRVWCEVLGLPRVGIDDNFFDVGGHSLLVIKLHRRLQAELGLPVALTDLYRFPSIRALVAQQTGAAGPNAVDTARERAALRMERLGARRDLSSRKRTR